MAISHLKKVFSISCLVASCALTFSTSHAGTLNLNDLPMYMSESVSPITMIVLGRDHKLYYEAYNDASDLDSDGNLDTKYDPNIEYYGYFDSYKCYTYNSSGKYFEPNSVTSDKTCSGQWSGDYLNYLTTARIDALRKVLYGGYRSTDSTGTTILERTHIPQDAHSWGKEYQNAANDGYDISDYTPYSTPSNGNYILFANTTLYGTTEPLLRVLYGEAHDAADGHGDAGPYRVWDWLSIERPVAGNRLMHGSSGHDESGSMTDYSVRVKVCVSGLLEDNCVLYSNGDYKPTGLLQNFGENDSMKFGLISGSYTKNLSGGVLRKGVRSITDEIDTSTGQFTSTVGIIGTLDRLKILNFSSGYIHSSNCGFIFNREINEGECRPWGNPIAEMMYEATRYFAGKGSATSSFTYSGSGDDSTLGLPLDTWDDPYNSSNNPSCAIANMLVISDVNPSYDSDSVPGSYFNSFSGDLSPSMDVSSLADTIWATEYGSSQSVFIGESAGNADNMPTAKTASSFSSLRGLAPEEPTKYGSYYAASVAYYGKINDVHSTASGTQDITSYVVALASNLPRITIETSTGDVTIIPFGKTVSGCGGVSPDSDDFQPTNTIVDFYVDSITSTTGSFRINFEDVGQGADHDMDAIATYSYVDNGDGTVDVTVTSTYAAGGCKQHLGYVISGTTDDGPYLVVRDYDTAAGADVDYFGDTPAGESPGGAWNDSAALPLTDTRTFTVSSTAPAILLENPLWFAAKWGNFNDSDDDDIPDITSEWDSDGDGAPDNYFLVTNALNLENQLTSAFQNIANAAGSSSSAAANSGALTSTTRLYQARFDSSDWSGELLSYPINTTTGAVDTSGSGPNGAEWDAGDLIPAANTRAILTYNSVEEKGVAFRWPSNPSSPTSNELTTAQIAILNTNPDSGSTDSLGEDRLGYLRGDQSNERSNGGTFRNRDTLLGDIVDSDPVFVGKPSFFYNDDWASEPETGAPYSSFKSTYGSRTPMIYVGANDGMLHAFNAETGVEVFAYVPNAAFSKLNELPSQNYSHYFYVNGPPTVGDAFFNSAWHTVLVGGLGKGGKGVYALDVTDPDTITEGGASSTVLWEFTDDDDADMGYSYSKPIIIRMNNGDWAAVFGNGYNNTESDGTASTTGNAVLYIVKLSDGSLIKKIDTETGTAEDPLSTSRPNGLASPTAVDTDGDNIADTIYAGDLFGHLWKFDVSASNSASWDVAFKSGSTPEPLFTAKDDDGVNQPITSRPTVGGLQSSSSGVQIFFGTGKYLESSDRDVSTATMQTFYGIHDLDTQISGRSALLEQQILYETTLSGVEYRITTANTYSSQPGWYMDLNLVTRSTLEGERQVSTSVLRNGKIIFATIIPDEDLCNYGGTSWLMELDAYTGGRLSYSPFDLSGDGNFDSSDFITAVIDGETVSIPVGGKKSGEGIITTPSVLSAGGSEYKYNPGSSGNIDVTTENPGLDQGRKSWTQIQ